MMDLKINGGSMEFSDDNKTTVSKSVAEEIYSNCIDPDKYQVKGNNKGTSKDATGNGFYRPDLNIKD